MNITDQVKALIQKQLPEAQVLVEDPMNDATHLRAVIVCSSFTGKNRIERHREVYKALGDAFSGPLHALQIITRTPEEMK